MITQEDIDAMEDGMGLVEFLRDDMTGCSGEWDKRKEAAEYIEQLERELARARVSREDDGMQIIGLQAQLAAEKALADRLADVVKNSDVSTGYCCCGDPIQSHGMWSGHSATDEGVYYAEKTLEEHRKARRL